MILGQRLFEMELVVAYAVCSLGFHSVNILGENQPARDRELILALVNESSFERNFTNKTRTTNTDSKGFSCDIIFGLFSA